MFELVAKTDVNWKKLSDVLPAVNVGRTSLVSFMDLLEPSPHTYALDFVTYTFYFRGNDDLVKIFRSQTNLKVLAENGEGYVHGTLREWKDFVIATSVKESLYPLRKLSNIVYSFFLKEGLEQLFHNMQRHEMKDKTFYLGEKK